jgi:hypothetical protein
MKVQAQWQCISGCGACCRLDPELRGEALEALDLQQQQTYLAMVGADGWCLHFDTGARRCRIYDQRPDFCRVDNLLGLFTASSRVSPAAAFDSASNSKSPADVDSQPAADAFSQVTGHLQDRNDRDELAIACCRQQIRSEWGGRGKVMKRFNNAIRHTIRQSIRQRR